LEDFYFEVLIFFFQEEKADLINAQKLVLGLFLDLPLEGQHAVQPASYDAVICQSLIKKRVTILIS